MYRVLRGHKFSFLLGVIPTNGISGSESKSINNILRNGQTVPKCVHHFTFPSAIYERNHLSTSSPILVISCLLIITIPVGVKWCFIVVLICIFLMTTNAEQFFMCLLAICISSLEKYLFSSSADFLIGMFLFLFLN